MGSRDFYGDPMTPKFIVYRLTCTVTKKYYVGQTRVGIDRRWKKHVHDALRGEGCRAIGAAIRKYKASSFTRESLEELPTLKEANSAEIKWIAQLNCRSPLGYNLGAGGGVEMTHEETRKRLSETSKRAMKDPYRLARHMQTFTTEQRSEMGRKAKAGLSPERRSEIAKKIVATMGPVRKSAAGKRAYGSMTEEQREKFRAGNSALTHEQRGAAARKWQAALSPEQCEERRRKAVAAAARFTPEQRSEIARRRAAAKSPEARRTPVGS